MLTDLTDRTATAVTDRTDRQLLAAVLRRARTAGWHEPFWRGEYISADGLTEVRWDRYSDDLTVTIRETHFGPAARVTLPREALTIRRAVDLLCTLGILPAEFSSAYAAGRLAGAS